MTVVHFTKRAQQYLTKQFTNQPESIGVYIALEKAGCAGYMYQIRILTDAPEDTTKLNVENIPVYIPNPSIARLQGATLDYQRQGIDYKAVFDNPNVTLACGCGDSVELIKPERDQHVSS